MSKLSLLTLTQFRCFSEFTLDCDHACNVIIGENGRGKTSILEAIYFLATTRSFRTRTIDSVIRHENPGCAVKGQLSTNDDDLSELRTKKQRGQKPEAFQQHTPLKNIKELAEQLPVSIIHRQSYIQFAQTTEERRRVLDWLLFHVEQNYHATQRAYQQALQNRNALLKQVAQPREIKSWSIRVAELGESLHQMRSHHCEHWFRLFHELIAQYCPDIPVQISYQRGWAAEKSLEQALVSNLAYEIQRGFTMSGPHRADLKLSVGGEAWERVLSTGQAKTVLFCLFFSQYLLLKNVLGAAPLVLLDDLFGDLDSENVQRLLSLASASDAQFFISTIGFEHELKCIITAFPNAKMFHVEHSQTPSPSTETPTLGECSI